MYVAILAPGKAASWSYAAGTDVLAPDSLAPVTSRTPFDAVVRARSVLSEHLVRLVLEAPEGFESTGVPDEWLALTVPGQFQTRYYTVRSLADGLLTLDVVVHEEGLVTEWAQTDCVGDVVGLSAPKGSFQLPAGRRLGGAGR